MKTLKTYIPIFVFSLLIAGIGILKAQPVNHKDDFLLRLFSEQSEETVAPLPFNTATITSEVLFQKLEKEYFSKDTEEETAPLPAAVQKMSAQMRLEQAWKKVSVVEDEPQIDDLPPAVKKFMAEYHKTLLAETKKK